MFLRLQPSQDPEARISGVGLRPGSFKTVPRDSNAELG